MVGVANVIGSCNQSDKGSAVDDFAALAEGYKEGNYDEHLNPDEDVLTVQTEWIPLVNAVSACQDVGAQLS